MTGFPTRLPTTTFPNTLSPISGGFNVSNATIRLDTVFPRPAPPVTLPPSVPRYVSPLRIDTTTKGPSVTIPVTSNVQVFVNAGKSGAFAGGTIHF